MTGENRRGAGNTAAVRLWVEVRARNAPTANRPQHLSRVEWQQGAQLLAVQGKCPSIGRRVRNDHDQHIHLAVTQLEGEPPFEGLDVKGLRLSLTTSPPAEELQRRVPRPPVSRYG